MGEWEGVTSKGEAKLNLNPVLNQPHDMRVEGMKHAEA